MSREPYSSNEFTEDLEVFTKCFIERPRLWGFPSQALTTIDGVTLSVSAGLILGRVLGADIGIAVGPSVYAALWWLSERFARSRIPNLDQYIAGDSVTTVLFRQLDHMDSVHTCIDINYLLGYNLDHDFS